MIVASLTTTLEPVSTSKTLPFACTVASSIVSVDSPETTILLFPNSIEKPFVSRTVLLLMLRTPFACAGTSTNPH